ncbi:MAG: UDP-3-O-(3-hydroxymyristoyl)glucosamine N-acyltransferase [Ignavibacteria bacterium]
MLLRTQYTVKDIAEFLQADIEGNSALVLNGIGRIEEPNPGEILFVSGKQFFPYIESCVHNCIIVPLSAQLQPSEHQAFIRVQNPHAAFATIISHVFPEQQRKSGISSNAMIHPSAQIGNDVTIMDGVSIGEHCIIGKGSILYPHVVLGDHVVIGEDCKLYPHAVCYANTQIGNRAIIHAGAVIGSDGFGYIEHADGSYQKIPHVGNVMIEDDVEIGANTTIDRSVVNSTVISRGVKIDNLVHIAHNVSIGQHTAFAAQVGIAGSAKIGARNRFAGQVGTVGHLSTADDVIVFGQSGIAQSIEQSGIYFGSPAIERGKEIRRIFASQQLPELLKLVTSLEQRIKELEQAVENQKTS